MTTEATVVYCDTKYRNNDFRYRILSLGDYFYLQYKSRLKKTNSYIHGKGVQFEFETEAAAHAAIEAHYKSTLPQVHRNETYMINRKGVRQLVTYTLAYTVLEGKFSVRLHNKTFNTTMYFVTLDAANQYYDFIISQDRKA